MATDDSSAQCWSLAVVDDIAHEKNNESYYVARDYDDETYIRSVWQIKCCPLKDKCSAQAWTRAAVWSMTSPDQCLVYLKQHLMVSGKHNLPESEAQEAMQLNDILVCLQDDTYQMRETYRCQVEAHKAYSEKPAAICSTDRPARQTKGTGKGNKANKGYDAADDPSQQLQQMVAKAVHAAMKTSLDALQFGASPRDELTLIYPAQGGQLAKTPRAMPGKKVEVSVEHLKTLRENARRSRDATNSTLCTLVECAKRIRTEAQVQEQVVVDLDFMISQL